MHPTKFLSRFLFFPFQVGFMGDDGLGGSTPQFSPQIQIPPPTQEREGSDGLDLQEYLSDSMVGNKTECITITHIRVTDIAIRLRRIPVGFYAAVKTENGIKRTSNKLVSVGKDVVEWVDEIVLPSNRLSRICLTAFASFELGPTLGNGEALCELKTTVGELLDRKGKLQFITSVEQSDGEVDSSRSSLEIEIERRVYGQNEYVAPSNLPESEEMPRLGELTDRGHHALIRYRELQEQRDLDESIRYFEHAQDLCPPTDPSRATVLFNLATAKLIYCRVNDSSPDLDVPINLYRDVLRLRPRGHPDHPFTLLSLGITLEARFQRQRDEADETEGESYLSQVLDVALRDSYAYHAAVLALASTAKPEQIQLPEIPKTVENDVDDSRKVQRLDAALQWIFHSDSCKHVLLDHLGILFCIRFDSLCDLSHPEKAISTLEAIVQFASDDHPNKPSWLDDLGVSLWIRYERFADIADLERSISVREAALQFTPAAHPDKPLRLDNLGHLLSTRYERFGDVVDLERLISLFEDALQFTPDGHPDKSLRLHNLGDSLSTRYKRFGDVVDLERSISSSEDALQFTPDGHPDTPVRLNNLGDALSSRYECFGDVVDLERSISLFEGALQLTPDEHLDKHLWQNNLGDALSARYERFGDIVDLERSISLFEDAIQFTPDGHPDKPLWLNNLGVSLSTRYKRFGDIVDLERSISLSEDALQFTPDGHPSKPVRLNNLGDALSARYERFGDIVDLERSISLFKEALQFTPDGHPDKPLRMGHLGSSFLTRYKRFGDIVDLERSISSSDNAVQITPDGHPDKPARLNNLGHSLSTRYKHFGDLVDLERSISSSENALQFTPMGIQTSLHD
jgi:tetratricopeptide (TPR) repeat protein